MKKYSVEIRYMATRCYIVEAETERLAENIALLRDIKRFPNDNPTQHRFDILSFRDCETMVEVD